MTEDEAKKRWCPMARVCGLNDTKGNREYKAEGGGRIPREHAFNVATRCIGSDCMAWRAISETYGIPSGTETVTVGGECGLTK